MNKFFLNSLLLVSIFTAGTSSNALTISELVFFGDSLSDVGNTSTWSLGFVPGSAYWEGRFSNGPVFSELLALDLGLGPLTTSTNGGNNFAYGGAQTSGTGGLNGLLIDDLDEQVSDFVQNRTAGPHSMFVVLAGANDLLNGQTDVSIPVNQIANDLTRLHSAGARQMVVMNLPRLGNTPRFNGNPSLSSTMNSLTNEFNFQLATAISGLTTTLSNTTIVLYDLALLFDHAIANPFVYGLTNTSDPAAPGLEAGDNSYDLNNVVSNPTEYLFWDEVHPTTTVHEILAEQIYSELQSDRPEGDYNGNGVVDAADYSVWLANLGQTVVIGTGADGNGNGQIDYSDFEYWKTRFGNLGNANHYELAALIPEPSGIILLLSAAVLIPCSRRFFPRAAKY